MRALLLLLAFGSIACGATAAANVAPVLPTPDPPPPPVVIDVRPPVCVEPCATWIWLTVERHPDNRAVHLFIDGPFYRRVTSRQLDGEASPRMWQLLYEHIPGGEYVVSAIVRRACGEERMTRPLTVIPRFGGQP